MQPIYELPSSIKELFEECDTSYRIIDYTIEDMDNIESMNYFLDILDINGDLIEEDYGTQVVLKHPDYDYKIVIDSGGLGDFYSHRYDVSLYED